VAERQDVERVARGIIEEASREFPEISLRLDFETPRDDHEDAYLWITPGTADREEINDIWGFVIHMVQDSSMLWTQITISVRPLISGMTLPPFELLLPCHGSRRGSQREKEIRRGLRPTPRPRPGSGTPALLSAAAAYGPGSPVPVHSG